MCIRDSPNTAFVLISRDSSRPSTSSAVSPLSMPSTSFAVSPHDIIPIPKANINKRQNKRKKGSAAVLTSSPYKADLVTAKAEKERLKKIKLELKKEKKDKKKKGIKKKRSWREKEFDSGKSCFV